MSDPFVEAELKAQNDIEAELLREFRIRAKYIELTSADDLQKSYENAKIQLSRAMDFTSLLTSVVTIATCILGQRRLQDIERKKKKGK